MTLDEQLEQLAALRYPRQVDVADGVMARVATLPLRTSPAVRPLWQRISTVAAAAVALLFVVSLAVPYFRSYDEEGMAGTLAQLNDYNAWNTVEEAAVNPYEYLYE